MNLTAPRQTCAGNVETGTTVALGCFDGVHRGHLSIIGEAVREAAESGTVPSVFSFAEPPALFFQNAAGNLLTTVREKTALLSSAGISEILMADFRDYRDFSSEEFVNDVLIKQMNAKRLICGYNFTFGRNGSGNADTLRTLFPGKVCVIPCVSVDGEPVSSTAVRRLISSGNLLRASVFLGRFYSISGTVIRGRGDGSRLGFPTANIIPPSVKLLPPPGVYVTTAELDGKEYRAVTDAGYAPTVDSSDTYRLETHVPRLSGDLYGKPLTVRFIDKIRDEKKYESESELVEAIRSDIGFAESYLLPKSR